MPRATMQVAVAAGKAYAAKRLAGVA